MITTLSQIGPWDKEVVTAFLWTLAVLVVTVLLIMLFVKFFDKGDD